MWMDRGTWPWCWENEMLSLTLKQNKGKEGGCNISCEAWKNQHGDERFSSIWGQKRFRWGQGVFPCPHPVSAIDYKFSVWVYSGENAELYRWQLRGKPRMLIFIKSRFTYLVPNDLLIIVKRTVQCTLTCFCCIKPIPHYLSTCIVFVSIWLHTYNVRERSLG